ncbi:MAG: site-specific DNA-methyltransferase [Helcococcus sp.]|nr:site-specific DNA-methyltransferase [Helcococcus sp.]
MNLEEVDISKEGYGLNFLGKSYAKYLSSLRTETFISPDIQHNSNKENENSENLYIVGDNIDALKHLLSSYSGKIKCIYIDPPYNTGSDGFVYPDNFQFNVDELSEKIGITEEEAQRILDLAGKSTHSAWLTFMYPRLMLARDLLAKEGVIFISIDDNEQTNLKLICDEIFGEENFIGTFVINTTPNGRDYGHIAKQHEYCLFYSKSFDSTDTNMLPNDTKTFKYYDKIGGFNIHPLYNSNESFHKDNRPNLYYPFYIDESTKDSDGFYKISLEKKKNSIEVLPPKSIKNNIQFVWRWGKKKSEKNLNKEIVGYKTTEGDFRILQKMRNDEKLIRSLMLSNEYTTRKGTSELEKIMGNKMFDFPKPVDLIKTFLQVANIEDGYVVDFFSGSSTTAEAIMKLNSEDNLKRKFIMVQLPENIKENNVAYTKGYKTIDEIARRRIINSAKLIKKDTNADIDYGFKTFYIFKPTVKTLVELEEFEPEINFLTTDMISVFDNEHSSGKESILATWLNEDGYGLTVNSRPYLLDTYQADLIGKSIYLINEGLEEEDVMTLIKKIENEELDINRVVVYVYSATFSVLQELRKNLKVLRNNKNVTLIERF